MPLGIERADSEVGHFLAEVWADGVARFLSFDEAYLRIVRWRPPERVQLSEFHVSNPEALQAGIARLFRGESLTLRVRQNRRRLLFSLFPVGGEPLRVVGTVVDATEGYRQEILQRAAELLRGMTPAESIEWLRRLIGEELEGVRVEPVRSPSPELVRELARGRLLEHEGGWLFPVAGGALWIHGRELVEEERRFLERLLRVVRLAEDYRRAVQVARRREDAYLQLLSLANILEAEREPERIIELTLEFLLSLTGMEAGVFARLRGRRLQPELVVGKLAGRVLEDYERLRPPVLRRAVKAAFRHRRVVEDLASVEEALGGVAVRAVVVAPLWVSGRPYGAIELFRSEAWGLSDEEREIFALAVRGLARALERAAQLEELERTREAILQSFGRILEQRDLETRGHTERVVRLTEFLGRRFGFRGKRLEALRWGAYLHDIGKLAIPDAVLLKPHTLDEREWEVMKSHPVVATRMLEPLGFLPRITLNVVRHHHERWDGRGYPDGLAGEAIPLEARLFAVADVFDALVSRRPYKSAWPIEQAVEELAREAGRGLDPRAVRVFLDALEARELPLPAAWVA